MIQGNSKMSVVQAGHQSVSAQQMVSTLVSTSFSIIVNDSLHLSSIESTFNRSPANKCSRALESVQQEQNLYVELSTFWYCFLALITTIGLLVSLVSNMIIIYLFTKTPMLRRNPSNIVAVNLSLSDLLYCIQWPSVIYCSVTQSTWMLEIDFLCQTFGFITVSTALASILTVLVMSIERAIVIIYSIHARNRITIRGAWLTVVLIWLISVSSCLPPLFGKFNRYTLDPSKTSCTLDYLSSEENHKLYILALYVFFWIIPALLIIICYSLIIVTFKRSTRTLKNVEASQCTTFGPPAGGGWNLSSHQAHNDPRQQQQHHQLKHSSSATIIVGSTRSIFAGRHQLRDSIHCNKLIGRLIPRRWQETRRSPWLVETSTQPNLSPSTTEWKTTSSTLNTNPPPALDKSSGLGLAPTADVRGKSVELPAICCSPLKLDNRFGSEPQILDVAPLLACGLQPDAAFGKARQLAIQMTSEQIECDTSQARVTDEIQLKEVDRVGQETGGANSKQDSIGPFSTSVAAKLNNNLMGPLVCRQTLDLNRRRWMRSNAIRSKTLDEIRVAPGGSSMRPPPPRQDSRFIRGEQLKSANGNNAGPARTGSASHQEGPPRTRCLSTTIEQCLTNHHQTLGQTLKVSSSGNRSGNRINVTDNSWRPKRSRSNLNHHHNHHHFPLVASESLANLRSNMQFRLAKMSFYLIMLWFVSWTPIATLAMLNSVLRCHRASALAVFAACTMTKLGPAFDVFIYGISHPKIKSKFREIIMWLFTMNQVRLRPRRMMPTKGSCLFNRTSIRSATGILFATRTRSN